ncbi:expressed unknown protein [Seminavis robusta]|uniref:Uncharacterized protein n=1 Tax=Seminavis robusta TaxID=568900 RepID=A0A9N8EC90_9STRA|nr:expressed unknown protein [Seminavis robusta]|eukprot:Sro735_g194940.1 n/a (349) ;mRNA; f:39539-40585
MGNEFSTWWDSVWEEWTGEEKKEGEAETPKEELTSAEQELPPPELSDEDKQRRMDELKGLAEECGFEHVHQAEVAIGGFLWVLQKSDNMEEETVTRLMDSIQGANDAVKQYTKLSALQEIPKMINPLKLVKLTKTLISVYKVQNGVKRLTRQDKDCQHTEDVVGVLKKVWVPQEAIEQFLEGFIGYMQQNLNTDVSDILCLAKEAAAAEAEGGGDVKEMAVEPETKEETKDEPKETVDADAEAKEEATENDKEQGDDSNDSEKAAEKTEDTNEAENNNAEPLADGEETEELAEALEETDDVHADADADADIMAAEPSESPADAEPTEPEGGDTTGPVLEEGKDEGEKE